MIYFRSRKYITDIYLVYEPHDFNEANIMSTSIKKGSITDINRKYCESHLLEQDDELKDDKKRFKLD